MSKKILVVLSEYGYWGEELVGPLELLDEAGYEVTFMTPTGERPHALPPSMEAGFWDPPLDKVVTDEYYATLTTNVDESGRLADPIDLSSWFPQRPYFNHANFGHNLEAYHAERAQCWEQLNEYDALLMVGGSGPMIDMVNNQRLHDVILGFYEQDKLIAAECYAVACLAFARDFVERKLFCKYLLRQYTNHLPIDIGKTFFSFEAVSHCLFHFLFKLFWIRLS